jgi:hypothetical protein
MRAPLVALAAATILAGCVDSERLRSGLGGPASAAEADQDPSKQTLASKVLSAIALERVTDRKADPARLNELQGKCS